MLDELCKDQRFFMFNMQSPAFQSDVGRKMHESNFSWTLKTLPMVHGTEQGLSE